MKLDKPLQTTIGRKDALVAEGTLFNCISSETCRNFNLIYFQDKYRT